jgi:thymidine kinase
MAKLIFFCGKMAAGKSTLAKELAARERAVLLNQDQLKAAGFDSVELEPWRVYQVEDARAFLAESGIDVDGFAPQVDGKMASAFIRARRPEAKSCCGPTCCS